jgi:PAS domain S-box-containing protein
MWFEGKLPAFRKNPFVGGLVSAGLVIAAICVKLLVPSFPTLTILFPAVLVSAWVGGAKWGIPTLLVCGFVGYYFLGKPLPLQTTTWRTTTIIIFILVGALIIFVVDVLGEAVDRYQHERRRLDLALKSAKAALWESHPRRPLYWNKNFYDLIGLQHTDHAPPAEYFFELVHPEDREKMREARRLMDSGQKPKTWDEFRLIRPDGKMLWLENHRTSDPTQANFYIGIIHDITERKNAEQKVELVLNELSHRIKNQYAVIIKIATDTYKQSSNANDFNEAFLSRMQGLARSNELLLKSGGQEVDLQDLLLSQVETFGDSGRFQLYGPRLTISANAAQYLAMAFHELSTNALKHGAFSQETGMVEVFWSVSPQMPAVFELVWKERCEFFTGAPTHVKSKSGFGRMVLEKLMPSAVEGVVEFVNEPDGIKWTLTTNLDKLLRP